MRNLFSFSRKGHRNESNETSDKSSWNQENDTLRNPIESIQISSDSQVVTVLSFSPDKPGPIGTQSETRSTVEISVKFSATESASLTHQEALDFLELIWDSSPGTDYEGDLGQYLLIRFAFPVDARSFMDVFEKAHDADGKPVVYHIVRFSYMAVDDPRQACKIWFSSQEGKKFFD